MFFQKQDIYYKSYFMYKCKFCGKEYEKQQSWASHQGKCKLNPNRDKAIQHLEYARTCKKDSKEKDTVEYLCQYCGKLCIGKNSLVQHEIRCKENPNCLTIRSNFIKYNEECTNGIRHHHFKGKTKETCDALKKGVETRKKRYENNEICGSFTNHKHSEDSKEKMRKSTFKYLQTLKDIKCPRYNKKSIEYIDNLNKTKGWHLQHAENGGEVEVCGYFLDGYDKELNIAFEYDEPNHYKNINESILKKKRFRKTKNNN